MNAYCQTFRLYERGEAGICCDVDGVALGPVKLVERAEKSYFVLPVEDIILALEVAYGALPEAVAEDLALKIVGIARSLNAGELVLAKFKALYLRLPEIPCERLAKMNGVWLEKYNHCHDPENGRFCETGGESGSAGSGPPNGPDENSGNQVGTLHPGKEIRHINQYPGGPKGTVIHFVNDNPHNPSPDLPVSEDTAKMIEDVVSNSGLKSVTINSTTGGGHKQRSHHYFGQAVDMDMIDGYSVGDPHIKDKVQRLQEAFRAHPNIAQNFGPAFAENTDFNGKVTIPKDGSVENHRTHIHIAGRN